MKREETMFLCSFLQCMTLDSVVNAFVFPLSVFVCATFVVKPMVAIETRRSKMSAGGNIICVCAVIAPSVVVCLFKHPWSHVPVRANTFHQFLCFMDGHTALCCVCTQFQPVHPLTIFYWCNSSLVSQEERYCNPLVSFAIIPLVSQAFIVLQQANMKLIM